MYRRLGADYRGRHGRGAEEAWLWEGGRQNRCEFKISVLFSTLDHQPHLDHWRNGPLKMGDDAIAKLLEELKELERQYTERFPEPLSLVRAATPPPAAQEQPR